MLRTVDDNSVTNMLVRNFCHVSSGFGLSFFEPSGTVFYAMLAGYLCPVNFHTMPYETVQLDFVSRSFGDLLAFFLLRIFGHFWTI